MRSIPDWDPESRTSQLSLGAPLRGVLATLSEQHTDILLLIDEVAAEPDGRHEVWPALRRLLLAHEKSEVGVVFPLLRAMAQTRGYADRHDDEAHALEFLAHRLDDPELSREAWALAYAHLSATVTAHIAEEEAALFAIAQVAIGEEACAAIELPFGRVYRRLLAAL